MSTRSEPFFVLRASDRGCAIVTDEIKGATCCTCFQSSQPSGMQAVGLYVIAKPRRGSAWKHRIAQVVCLLLYLACAGRRFLASRV